MNQPDPSNIAARLTANERTALRSLPAHDRGHMPDEVWWAYYSILDQGLAESDGNFQISATLLGEEVLRTLRKA
ncbi:hypothetical protein FAZ95_14930 [Trinickia violacea]|uniref:Uncharacterized protein n=1 Tax=Trinickia violacea TaxID=2571746 RepID=A0A4P8IWV6_9BURK|nr:hypothetical protein [Trinickia violacea]QCP50349.1 hypothetical protein FAZ95_14930 [Trinickia violacea]